MNIYKFFNCSIDNENHTIEINTNRYLKMFLECLRPDRVERLE